MGISLSLQEFVQFLERAISLSPDVLEQAWKILDQEPTGVVSDDEWEAVVEERLGYFGPSKRIFGFLDSDGLSGSISFEEFMILQRFVGKEYVDFVAFLKGRFQDENSGEGADFF